MIKERICIHHNDADGKMSAAIYKLTLYNPVTEDYDDCEFIEACHSRKEELKEQIRKMIPIFETPLIKEIIVVDFSFDENFMLFLKTNCEDFYWVDHHITAKKSCKMLWDSKDIKGIRSIDKSAAELTWELFDTRNNPINNYKVDLVGDYDTWKFKFGDETRHFAEVNRYYEIDDFVKILQNFNFFTTELKKGKILYEDKLRRIEEKITGSYIITINFEGYNCGLMNNSEYYDASQIGNSICEQGYDISMTFAIKSNHIIFSLRCIHDDIDVSMIAVKYGGGGHSKAAGFVMPLKQGLDFIYDLYLPQ